MIVFERNKTKSEIIKIFFLNWQSNSFNRTSLIIDCQFIAFDKYFEDYNNKKLLDINCTIYNIIDESLIELIYKKLNI